MSTEVQPANTGVTAPAVKPLAGRLRTFALLIVLLGLLLDLLDIVIVNVALPTIQEGIGATPSQIQWMVAGYTLSFAVLLVTSGRLGDIVGRKRMFLIGVAGFTIASLLSGLAQSPDQLIAFRFLQGAMGAAMVPQVMALIQVMYPPAERGKAFSWLSVVFAAGTVGGPIVGAVLTSANFAGWSWRTIFLINVPLGIMAFFVALKLVPESTTSKDKKLDVPAVLLVTVALLMLIYPLVQGRELGWPTWIFVSMIGSVVVFGILIAYSRRKTEAPLIPVSLFKHRSFRGGLFLSLLFMSGTMPFFLVHTIYLQLGQQYSVIHAGLTGIVWGAFVPLFTFISSRHITPKLGRLGLQLGLLMMIVGMVLLIWTVHTFDHVTTLQLAPGLIIGGAGMGMTYAPLLTYTLNDVPVDDAGSASGIYNTVMQTGAVLGIVIGGLIFFTLLGSNAQSTTSQSFAAGLRTDLVAAGIAAAPADQVVAKSSTCYIDRMKISDPIADLPSCRNATTADGISGDAQTAAVAAAVRTNQAEATRANYQVSLERALLFQIGVFLFALLFSFMLPRRVTH